MEKTMSSELMAHRAKLVAAYAKLKAVATKAVAEQRKGEAELAEFDAANPQVLFGLNRQAEITRARAKQAASGGEQP
jgi:hypothetical protein